MHSNGGIMKPASLFGLLAWFTAVLTPLSPAMAEEMRQNLEAASEITVVGPIDLEIVQGESNQIVFLSGSAADHEKVQLIQNARQISLDNLGSHLKARMTLRALSALEVSGGAVVVVTDFSLSDLDAKVFADARITASGSCATLTGRTNFFDGCSTDSEPVFDASRLICQKVVFTLRGENCSAAVNATEELEYEFRDGGVLVLTGAPATITRKGKTDRGELKQN